MEVFVKSINHPLYMISSEGRVFSKKGWKFLKPIKAKRDFRQVSMDGKNVSLHKEMAASFSLMKLTHVWFRNQDKSDLRLDNLVWTLENARPQHLPKPKLYKYEEGVFVPLKEEE